MRQPNNLTSNNGKVRKEGTSLISLHDFYIFIPLFTGETIIVYDLKVGNSAYNGGGQRSVKDIFLSAFIFLLLHIYLHDKLI